MRKIICITPVSLLGDLPFCQAEALMWEWWSVNVDINTWIWNLVPDFGSPISAQQRDYIWRETLLPSVKITFLTNGGS